MWVQIGERFGNAVALSQLSIEHIADLMEMPQTRVRSIIKGTSRPGVQHVHNLVRFIITIENARDQGLLPGPDDGVIYPRYYRVLWNKSEREVEVHELYFNVSPLAKVMADMKVTPMDIKPYLTGYSGDVEAVLVRRKRTRLYLDAFTRVALALQIIQKRGGFTANQFDAEEFNPVIKAIKDVALPLRK